MTASITTPFPIFTDRNGQPLDGGYVYVGTANLDPVTNPVSIFWDAGLTVPAAQPVRTSGGYAVNNGAPSVIYTSGDFSITVCDKNNTPLYSAPSYTFRVNSDAITFGAVIISTSIVPDAAGGAFNGTIALPWSSTVSRAMQARTLNLYSQTQPVVAADLGRLTQLSMDVLVCRQTSSAGAAVLVNFLNTASITRTGAGLYTVVPTVALPANYVVVPNAAVFSAGTTPVEIICSTRGTASLVIEVRINNVNADLAWDLVIKANPAVADPIL